jgi:glyoxylase I family protein
MSCRGIHHHKIFVCDTDRSVKFYRDLLGFEVVYEATRSNLDSYDKIMGINGIHVRVTMLWLGSEASTIALIQFLHPPMDTSWQPHITKAGFSTFAVAVTDIDAVFERLAAAGVESISQPVDILRNGRRTARACYIFDPDGLPIELYQAFATLEETK